MSSDQEWPTSSGGSNKNDNNGNSSSSKKNAKDSTSSTSSSRRSSTSTSTKSGKKKKITNTKTPNSMQYISEGLFPCKLHDLLDYAESCGMENVISWTKDGRAFIVHDQDKLVETLLPLFFGQTKYRSFHRQLNMWSFERASASSEVAKSQAAAVAATASKSAGAKKTAEQIAAEQKKQIIFQHPFFLRGQKAVCQHMNREIFKTRHLALKTSSSSTSETGGGTKRKFPIERKVHPAKVTKSNSSELKSSNATDKAKHSAEAGSKASNSNVSSRSLAAGIDVKNFLDGSGKPLAMPLTMRLLEEGVDASNFAGKPFYFLDMDTQSHASASSPTKSSLTQPPPRHSSKLPAIDAQAQQVSIQSAAAASLARQVADISSQQSRDVQQEVPSSAIAQNQALASFLSSQQPLSSIAAMPFNSNAILAQANQVLPSTSGGGSFGATATSSSTSMDSISFHPTDVEPDPIFESPAPPSATGTTAASTEASLLSLHSNVNESVNRHSMLPPVGSGQLQQSSLQDFQALALESTSRAYNNGRIVNSFLYHHPQHQAISTAASATASLPTNPLLQSIGNNTNGSVVDGVSSNAVLPQRHRGPRIEHVDPQGYLTMNVMESSTVLPLSHFTLRGLAGFGPSLAETSSLAQQPRPNSDGTGSVAAAATSAMDPPSTEGSVQNSSTAMVDFNTGFLGQNG